MKLNRLFRVRRTTLRKFKLHPSPENLNLKHEETQRELHGKTFYLININSKTDNKKKTCLEHD